MKAAHFRTPSKLVLLPSWVIEWSLHQAVQYLILLVPPIVDVLWSFKHNQDLVVPMSSLFFYFYCFIVLTLLQAQGAGTYVLWLPIAGTQYSKKHIMSSSWILNSANICFPLSVVKMQEPFYFLSLLLSLDYCETCYLFLGKVEELFLVSSLKNFMKQNTYF